MTTSTVPASGSIATTVGRYRWLICGLLFLATTINYIDRQVLSMLAKTLQDTLHWTENDYGDITAAFAIAYGVGLLGVGRARTAPRLRYQHADRRLADDQRGRHHVRARQGRLAAQARPGSAAAPPRYLGGVHIARLPSAVRG